MGKVVDAAHSEAEATDGDALTRAATRIQAHYRGHVVRKAMKHYRIGGQLSEVRTRSACHTWHHCLRPHPASRSRQPLLQCGTRSSLHHPSSQVWAASV